MNWKPRDLVLGLLRAYKWVVSPMLLPACRYVPTCSEYAMEAIERFGVIRGGFMAVKRLLRCHPLGGGGFDPVVRAENSNSAAVRQSAIEPCGH